MAKWYCGSWAWINEATGEAKQYFCGLATCDRERCQKLFWLNRVKLISGLIPKYKLDKFFTLTMDRNLEVKECWNNISKVWTNTRRGLRRDYPNFKFVAILEAHKDGYPHIHGFTNTWIKTKEWSRRFSGCGGGKIAWIEKVDSGDITKYVSKQFNVVKYVGKNQVITARKYLKPRQRSIWRSVGMKADFELEDKRGEWKLEKGVFFLDENNKLDILYKVEYNEKHGYRLTQVPKPFSKETICLLRRLREKSQ